MVLDVVVLDSWCQIVQEVPEVPNGAGGSGNEHGQCQCMVSVVWRCLMVTEMLDGTRGAE